MVLQGKVVGSDLFGVRDHGTIYSVSLSVAKAKLSWRLDLVPFVTNLYVWQNKVPERSYLKIPIIPYQTSRIRQLPTLK